MACIDQQPNFKHYCRVCKKGFMCGRALGGHMRAHGIGDESGNLDDDDPISDWEEKFGGGSERTSNKRMYQLRTNPNRLRSCRTCENCGKEFLSWKSFLEHGKCSSDDASDSLISSHESEGDEDECAVGSTRCGSRWSKRKRSLRSKVSCFSTSSYPPSEDDDILLARCLVQLANTVVDPPAVEPEESCASASREMEERRNPHSYFDPSKSRAITIDHHRARGVPTPKGMFECKACKKLFNSHQALGGHRASHKKVKGCYAGKQDQVQQDYNNSALGLEDDVITNNEEFLIPPSKQTPFNFQFEQGPSPVGAARRKPKVHECSICHRVFASGQALGGHKRCHWITSNSPETSSLPKFHFQDNNSSEPIHHHHHHHGPTINVPDKLDLNVPAWAHVPDITRYPPDPLGLNISTDMQLQPWIGPDTKDDGLQLKNGDDDNINGNIVVSSNVKNETVDNKNAKTQYIEDEADSKLIKLARLGDLNEMVNIGSPSKWLQVGIGSTTRVDAADM